MDGKEILVISRLHNSNICYTYYTDFTFAETPGEHVSAVGIWKIEGDKVLWAMPTGTNRWRVDSCSREVINALNKVIEKELLGG